MLSCEAISGFYSTLDANGGKQNTGARLQRVVEQVEGQEAVRYLGGSSTGRFAVAPRIECSCMMGPERCGARAISE